MKKKNIQFIQKRVKIKNKKNTFQSDFRNKKKTCNV